MSIEKLKTQIEFLWDHNKYDAELINSVVQKLDNGELRVSEKIDNKWIVHEHIKLAILLFFKNTKSVVMDGDVCNFFDKIPLKTAMWSEVNFQQAGFRSVPGAIIRHGAYIAKSSVIMPSFTNIGAYIDESTMVDSHALIGSCAQIGKRCHISDGVTIGGVLEPLRSTPVIIEDDCFVGAKSVLTDGVIVEEGSIIGASTTLTASTKIINRETNEVLIGRIPAYSVVVPGSYKSGNVFLSCAIIIKTASESVRKKISINELLRD